MAANKKLIVDAIKARLALITTYDAPVAFQAIVSDKIRVNLSDWQDMEIPAVQIIDAGTLEIPERCRGAITWSVVVQICLRERNGFACTQETMWLYEQAAKEAIMGQPDLGLTGANALPYTAAIKHIMPTDRAADLHTYAPNYVVNLGFQVLYYEPMTRRNC